MRSALHLFRTERAALPFFGALAQSALGTGAGYVALLLIAYDRFESPWAIGLVLAADLVPSMLLGPVLGALADRFSRKTCVVTADITRGLAFGAIVFVDSFGATLVLAALAGAGNALFRPASQAAVPGLVKEENVPAALAVFGATDDLGFTLGPALAAGLLLIAEPELITGINGLTFLVSAIVLARVSFGARPIADGGQEEVPKGLSSLVTDVREGFAVASGTAGLRTILVASSVILLFCGIFNVGELLFAEGELGAGGSAFSLLVMVFGLGFLAGSLLGARGGDVLMLKRGYEAGLLLIAVGFIGCALAPSVWVAVLTFAAAGLGNGLVLVHERLIIQAVVPDRLLARVYGIKDALTAWAFGVAFASGGALIDAFDVRSVFLAAGVGCALVAGAAVVALRPVWREPERASASRLGSVLSRLPGKDGPNALIPRDRWLALLDDLDQRSYD